MGMGAGARDAGTSFSFGDGGAVCRAGEGRGPLAAGMMGACIVDAEAETSGAGVEHLLIPGMGWAA